MHLREALIIAVAVGLLFWAGLPPKGPSDDVTGRASANVNPTGGCGRVALAVLLPLDTDSSTAFSRAAAITFASAARASPAVPRILLQCPGAGQSPELQATLATHDVAIVSLPSSSADCALTWPWQIWAVSGIEVVAVVVAGTEVRNPLEPLLCPDTPPSMRTAPPLAVYVHFAPSDATPPPHHGAFAATPIMVVRPHTRVAKGLERRAQAGTLAAAELGLVHDPRSEAVSLLEYYFFALPPSAGEGGRAAGHGQGGGAYLGACLIQDASAECSGTRPVFALPAGVKIAPGHRSVVADSTRNTIFPDDGRPQLVLLHVPRSGGRSIECTYGVCLAPLFGAEFMHRLHPTEPRRRGSTGAYKFATNPYFQSDQRLVHSPQLGPPAALCCGGHANLASLHHTFGPPTPQRRYVMMFRKVGPRIASALAHDLRWRRVSHLRVSGALKQLVRDQQLDLDTYVRAPVTDRQVNHAVALLASTGQGTLNSADLAKAKYKLLEIGVTIGIFERYSETLQLWCRAAGYNTTALLACSDAGPATPHPSASQIEALERLHALDVELYVFAASLFRRQWHRYHAGHRLPVSPAPRPQCGELRGCLLTSRPAQLVANTTQPKNGEVVCWRRCNTTTAWPP